MSREKVIVIGCDDSTSLAVILNHMKAMPLSGYHVVTATREVDLAGIVKSVSADLILLAFRYNQPPLTNLHALTKKSCIPFLCLTKSFENHSLHWSPEQAVFAYPFEYLSNKEYLAARINSVFLLISNRPSEKGDVNSFASFGMRTGQAGDPLELSRYVLELDQKAEVLLKIKNQITGLYPDVDDPTRVKLTAVVNTIKLSAHDHRLWDDFKLYFDQANPNFLLALSTKHPALTQIDLKYCCYLKMNMTNDDIRNLLGINQESVRTHKYRLKLKMSLPKEQSLRNYLGTVNPSMLSPSK